MPARDGRREGSQPKPTVEVLKQRLGTSFPGGLRRRLAWRSSAQSHPPPAHLGQAGLQGEAAVGYEGTPRPVQRPQWTGHTYRAPQDLQVTMRFPERILIVGSCLSEGWPAALQAAHTGCRADLQLFNHIADLPPTPFDEMGGYDLQLVQIPLCSVLPESAHFRLGYNDSTAFEELFDSTRLRLSTYLDAALRYYREHHLLTFVANFLCPQESPIGRLQPRTNLSNLTYFVRCLNDELSRMVDPLPDAYVLDLDSLSASLGRRHVQDDLIWSTSHGSVLTDWDHLRDQGRLEPPEAASTCIEVRSSWFMMEACLEVFAMFRTAHQVDAVKLVVVDLDDTLWRGVVAEEDDVSVDTLGGWPMGIVEALAVLKRRGVLLGIISKNDRAVVERVWARIFSGQLEIDDFASVKIDWRPKADNLSEMLAEVGLLPGSVVFVDDNPVERASIKEAFPQVRTLGGTLYDIRRVLLWAPETQVPCITGESSARTAMVQAQTARENLRSKVSREEFLASLQLSITLDQITSSESARLGRAVDLINRTNQFNTTGERWKVTEMAAFLDADGGLLVADVADVYTRYGLTVVAIVDPQGVRQMVMSCRVLGLDVEQAVLAHLASLSADAGRSLLAVRFKETGRNHLAKAALERSSFRLVGERFERSVSGDLDPPPHVTMHGSTEGLGMWCATRS